MKWIRLEQKKNEAKERDERMAKPNDTIVNDVRTEVKSKKQKQNFKKRRILNSMCAPSMKQHQQSLY